ncbi:MAG: YodC family protein [Desulfomonilaceae bacterium]
MSEFKIGDVVQLKSGGPHMTVYKVDEDEIYTQWFDEKNKQQAGVFVEAVLDKV